MNRFEKIKKEVLQKYDGELDWAFNYYLKKDLEYFQGSFSKLYLQKDTLTEYDILYFIGEVFERLDEFYTEYPECLDDADLYEYCEYKGSR
jgi:hypothetical protein